MKFEEKAYKWYKSNVLQRCKKAKKREHGIEKRSRRAIAQNQIANIRRITDEQPSRIERCLEWFRRQGWPTEGHLDNQDLLEKSQENKLTDAFAKMQLNQPD
jgi:hypothetical protein